MPCSDTPVTTAFIHLSHMCIDLLSLMYWFSIAAITN